MADAPRDVRSTPLLRDATRAVAQLRSASRCELRGARRTTRCRQLRELLGGPTPDALRLRTPKQSWRGMHNECRDHVARPLRPHAQGACRASVEPSPRTSPGALFAFPLAQKRRYAAPAHRPTRGAGRTPCAYHQDALVHWPRRRSAQVQLRRRRQLRARKRGACTRASSAQRSAAQWRATAPERSNRK